MKSFDELYNLDISSKVKKNNGLDYLNWLDCFLILKENGMQPVYDAIHTQELSTGQIIVKVRVDIGDKQGCITYTDARSRDFEFIKQRAFVKCVAINWGLGLKLWEKEDAAGDDEHLSEKITKLFGELIGAGGFPDANSLFEALNTTDKILGKTLKSGTTEEKKIILNKLEALTGDNVF